MGKLNELSMLAKEAGYAEDLVALKQAIVKQLLAKKQHDPHTAALAKLLNVYDLTQGELIGLVHVNKKQAEQLRHGDILHHWRQRNSDGTPLRVRVSGRCQTWKTRLEDYRLPVKYGLYENGAITPANEGEWYVA